MIYLIGALPRCGKTTLVKQMSRKTNISWLSSDTLDSIAQEYTTSKDWKMKFPYSHLRQISKTRNNDDFYSEHSPTKIINTIKFLIS